MYIYTAKVLDKIDNPPRDGRPVWNSIKIGVFRVENDNDKEEQVGEYIRNYPAFFNTFCYFRKDDKEYALYSPDYTATRIMELPTCKDIGGEEPHSLGFCPTDYYIPSYIDREDIQWDDRIIRHRVHNPTPENLLSRMEKRFGLTEKPGELIQIDKPSYPITPHLYYPFGFIAGCVWGDDTTWKIQYLDLSEAEKGIIKRDERFGYISLPEKMTTLKDAIDMSDYFYYPDDQDPDTSISMTIQVRFDLHTGKKLDYPV